MRGVVFGLLLLSPLALADVVGVFVNNGEGKPAAITLGSGVNKLKFTATPETLTLSSTNGDVFSLSPAAATTSAFNEEIVGTVELFGELSVSDIHSGDIELLSAENDLQNWLTPADCDDVFDDTPLGWQTASGAPLTTQKCGGITLLGGPNSLASEKISKTFALPKHSQIQITARFHFIDDWDDDSAYMKVDENVMWTEQYSWCPDFFQFMCSRGHSVCGRVEIPDRVGRLITVSLPHAGPSVTIEFGTTIHESVGANLVSYGVSSVSIEVR